MERHFTVAIDGPSGAGKSTLAKAVAQKMGALYLDTGAMYRAVGLAALERGTDMADQDQVAGLLESLQVDVRYQDGGQRVYLNGQDVSEAIRQPRVSSAASQVSAVPAVREKLVAMQRQIAQGKSVVMDGRDIGTKVLPDATLKIYLRSAHGGGTGSCGIRDCPTATSRCAGRWRSGTTTTVAGRRPLYVRLRTRWLWIAPG